MNHLLRIVTLSGLIAGILVTGAPATAQDGADTCSLPAVALPLFDATPPAEIPGSDATPASPDDPSREATDDEVAEFTSAIETIVACINTGEGPLINAVFTDRYLASRFVGDEGLYLPDFERQIDQTSGEGLSQEPLVIDNVEDVRVREDGRISGRVVLSSAGQSWRDTLILARVGDYWLIDDVILESRES